MFSWFKMQLWRHSMGDESFWLDFKTQVELTVVCMQRKWIIFTNYVWIRGQTKCMVSSVPTHQ